METTIVAKIVGIRVGDDPMKDRFDEEEDGGNDDEGYAYDWTSQRLRNYINEIVGANVYRYLGEATHNILKNLKQLSSSAS